MRCAVLCWLIVSFLARAALAEHQNGRVFVIRPTGMRVYEDVIEEFNSNCRVHARLYEFQEVDALRRELRKSDVVLAVGQQAVQALAGSPAQVVAARAFFPPPWAIAVDQLPAPKLTLEALRLAKPSVRRVGVVYGPSTEHFIRQVDEEEIGIQLVAKRVHSPAAAILALRDMQDRIDALWLVPDLQVLTPQVFQYAVTLEIERSLPLAAATRHQVKSGAVLAYDADPQAIGRAAAEIVHQLLDGVPPRKVLSSVSVEMMVNGHMVRVLGIDPHPLAEQGARIE